MALETWNGSVWVVVATGTIPMLRGRGGHPGRDEDGVEAPAHLVDPIVGHAPARRLQTRASPRW